MDTCLLVRLGFAFREREGFTADRDLSLLHCFEQRGLHLRGSAVDFVGEHDVCEDRPLLHHEVASGGAIDECAHEVGGEKIRRELHALELRLHPLRKRGDSGRFREPGNTFDQNVSIGKEPEQEAVYQLFLAHDDAVNLLLQLPKGLALLGDVTFDRADVL